MTTESRWLPCLLVVLCGLAGCENQQRDVSSRQCAGVVADSIHVAGAAIDEATRCKLVALALHELRSAPRELDVRPRHTPTSVLITPLSLADSTGAVNHEYWSVVVALPDRGHDAEVQIDRTTGGATARRAHKPL